MLRFFYNVTLKTVDTKGIEDKKSIPMGSSLALATNPWGSMLDG
jgi:hypothetical protein